jgi:hypothetical protein
MSLETRDNLKRYSKRISMSNLVLAYHRKKLTRPGAEQHPRNFSKFLPMILAYNKGSPPPENSTA